MTEAWHPRADILALSHRWPVVFLLFLAGSLVGWGAGLVLPSPYRAEASFYVGFNADPITRNPDDYKNWYLSQLEVLAVSDNLLAETLSRLQAQEDAWNSVDSKALKSRVGTYWRNAGMWRLAAEWSDGEHALQLCQAWSAVFLEWAQQSISTAALQIDLEAQIKAASVSLAEVQLRSVQLGQVRAALWTWQQALTPTRGEAVLDPLERWRLLALAASLVDFNPVELTLVNQVPAPDSPAQAYAPWAGRLIASADSQIVVYREQETSLPLRLAQLRESLTNNIRASHGLSGYLVVEPLEAAQPAQPVRRSSLMAVVGGSLAVLAYALFWLARPPKKAAP